MSRPADPAALPILHIGYHKTATTWFQLSVYPNVPELAYIPKEKVKKAFLKPHALSFDPARTRRKIDKARRKIAKARGGAGRLALCEEALSGHYRNAGLHGALAFDMARRLHETFGSAEIVIFIRNQPDIITSAYLQNLRRGEPWPPGRFLRPTAHLPPHLRRPFRRPEFHLDHFVYPPLIRRYQALFAAHVHVFLHEDLRADQDRFLADFGARLGIAIDPARLPASKPNMSYRAHTARLARLLNRLAVDGAVEAFHIPLIRRDWRRGLLEAWNRGPLAGPRLTPRRLFGDEAVAAIERHYARSNRELEEMLGRELAPLGYPVAAAAPPRRVAA